MEKQILVAGSYVVAFSLKGKTIPPIGQTLVGDTYGVVAGGKGNNQAIAAKLQGANVTFITKLGNDSYGKDAIERYQQTGLYGPAILTTDQAPTGAAGIFIDENGNNSILMCPCANLLLTADEIVGCAESLDNLFLAGFQLENDVTVVCEAITRLSTMGVATLLDPAPVAALPESVYKHLTYIKPNEHEAAGLTGRPVESVEDAYRAADWFVNKGVGTAIITLGERGTVAVSATERGYIPTTRVAALDSTGAGDIFSGTLMAALAMDLPLMAAIDYANRCAALSVTRFGVYEATPTATECEGYLRAVKEAYGLTD